MECISVIGGNKLTGSVMIGGMKNSALPIIYATILTGDTCIIDNIPRVSDIENSLEILRGIGAEVKYLTNNSVSINTESVLPCISDYALTSAIRGSSYLLGAELGRFHKTKVAQPGGCSIGARPLDLHMKAFELLGAKTQSGVNGYNIGEAPNGLTGGQIRFSTVTVGGTVNAILASVLADGVTNIENAAREPHIVDLATFLNCCGANITGAGTSSIKVRGVASLHGCRHMIAPDMIEAGTFMTAVAVTGGKVDICGVIPKHLEAITASLREMGVTVEEHEDYVTVISDGNLKSVEIKTGPYPEFPTDMQPQLAAALCFADGLGVVHESIFSNRFKYIGELAKMGANVKLSDDGKEAFIIGNASKMTCAPMVSTDLRAGAAMIIAALATKGESIITNIETIERGYYKITEKLSALGATIEKKLLETNEQSLETAFN